MRFLARRALKTIPKTKPYFQNGWNIVEFFTLFVQACLGFSRRECVRERETDVPFLIRHWYLLRDTLRPPTSLFSCCLYPKLKSSAIVSLNTNKLLLRFLPSPPSAHRTLSRILVRGSRLKCFRLSAVLHTKGTPAYPYLHCKLCVFIRFRELLLLCVFIRYQEIYASFVFP